MLVLVVCSYVKGTTCRHQGLAMLLPEAIDNARMDAVRIDPLFTITFADPTLVAPGEAVLSAIMGT